MNLVCQYLPAGMSMWFRLNSFEWLKSVGKSKLNGAGRLEFVAKNIFG